jgi:hypothetical protein
MIAFRKTAALALLLGLVTLGLTACAASPDDGGSSCGVQITYNPDPLQASLTRKARAVASAGPLAGVATFEWRITHGAELLSITPAAPDSSEIEFPITDAGIYDVEVNVPGCNRYNRQVNVLQPGAVPRAFRLRITPPPSTLAPPQDRTVIIPGGADFAYGALLLEPIMQRFGTVRSGADAVPAYLRFTPTATEGATVAETVSASDGSFSVSVGAQLHDVLVVPTGGQAPYLLSGWNPMTPLIEGPIGSVITGVVLDPDGVPLAGARVSMKRSELPSTVGVTAADGTFTLRVQSGLPGELMVVPPADSGLPRLLGAADGVSFSAPLQIRYRNGLQRRDVGGVQLRRQGAAMAGAQAIFVGELADAGRINGTTPLRGVVRIAATAGSDGRLLATRVPQAALFAVVLPAARELAVLPFDATAAPPAALDAPAMRTVTGTALTSAGVAAPGAVVDLLPRGALALADVPGLSTTAGSGGAFSLPAAPGGSYLGELSDPRGRGAGRSFDVAAPGSVGAISLALGRQLVGSVLPLLSSSPVKGAAIELFCFSCSRAAQQRALSSAVTDVDGSFRLIVPEMAPSLLDPQ